MTAEPLTPAQIAGRMTAALATITSLWPDMLTPASSSRHGGTAPILSDDDESDADTPRTLRVVAVRQEVNWQVRGWAQVLIEDHDLDDRTPDGHDTLGLCAYLRKHVDLMSTHEAGLDALQELEDCAHAVEHCVYGAPVRRQALGPCPDPTCDGTVRDNATFDDAGRRLASCTRCHVEQAQMDWAESMGITVPDSLTKHELIQLAHEDYGLTLTEHGITCLVSRGTLTPLDRKSRPQRYGYFACIDYLTERRART